jgi:hypothetical protein
LPWDWIRKGDEVYPWDLNASLDTRVHLRLSKRYEHLPLMPPTYQALDHFPILLLPDFNASKIFDEPDDDYDQR